jgi:four helix bundle protein
LAVIRFCRTLPRNDEAREAAGQLRRASKSASANYRASRRARSRNEWRAQLGLALEELDEADHWVSVIADSDLAAPPQNLISECRQLRAILAKSWATSAPKPPDPAAPSRRNKKAKRPPYREPKDSEP